MMQIRLLNEEVLEAAVTVQRLLQRRANLKDLNHKLQVVLLLCSTGSRILSLFPNGLPVPQRASYLTPGTLPSHHGFDISESRTHLYLRYALT